MPGVSLASPLSRSTVLSHPATTTRSCPAGYPPSPEAALYRQRQAKQPRSITLLDESGLLVRPVPFSRVLAWKAELHHGATASRAARLNLWLGEYKMAAEQAPVTASFYFARTERLTSRADPLHGLAAYDRAIALDDIGAFGDSERAFHQLLDQKPRLSGFDRQRCSLWYTHVHAHAEYHRVRARLGIPEPQRLDPMSGPAALAACLRSLGLPWSQNTLRRTCRITETGSSVQDLIAAGKRLGARVTLVAVNQRGLFLLPKPALAVVEQDHLVCVTHAGPDGVDYLCSDCGSYPGGRIHLDLGRWQRMDCSACLAVTRPGSSVDRWLQAVLHGHRPPVRIASVGPLAGLVSSLDAAASIRSISPYRPCIALYGLCAPSLHCSSCTQCAFDAAGPAGSPAGGSGGGPNGGGAERPLFASASAGPSSGEPVNLATGEEEYHPEPDLRVYNPIGPSVIWQRNYESLRSSSSGNAPENDFATGWSQSYNVGIYDSAAGGAGTKYVVEPDGARISVTAASVPTSTNPAVSCSVQAGYPMLVTWNYNGTAAGYYTITFGDRSKWTTLNPVNASSFATNGWCPVGQMSDRSSNSIDLIYDSTSSHLTSITDSGGAALLTISRDSSGYITAVSDRYNRSVYYAAASGYYPELGTVSQIVATGTSNPPVRYSYGYTTVAGPTQMHTITTPSPTGTGNSTATIDYDLNSSEVTDVIDANGNKHSYSGATGGGTVVTMTNSQGATVYSYKSLYGSNLSETSRTDGANNQLYSLTYADPNDPLRPSLAVDGNSANSTNPPVSQGAVGSLTPTGTDAPAGGANWDVVLKSGNVVLPIASSTSPGGWSVTYATSLSVTVPSSAVVDNNYEARYNTGAGYKSAALDVTTTGGLRKGSVQYSWDQYGNELSRTTTRGTVLTFSYSYANFGLGELTQFKEGAQSPTSFTYYEPSGLIHTITAPLPGTVGSSSTTVTTFSYDTLGNPLSVTTAGNNAASTIQTSYSYTTDGSYTQPEALGEPIAVVDNLGKVVHLRYDSRANRTVEIDPLGYETDQSFNLADQPSITTYPATGQTGAGHATTTDAYLYPGGPQTSTTYYDESGAQVRQASNTFGAEGELLSTSGSVEPVSISYDAEYRVATVLDGGSHQTAYSYGPAGYLASITYPGGDSLRYTQYDSVGRVQVRMDGNNAETDFVAHDPDDLLTDVIYPASPGINVHVGYDAFDRRVAMTDGAGTASYVFDDGDRLTSAQTTYTGVPSQTVGYTYFPDGSREQMTTPAGVFAYTYDADGRLAGLQNPYGESSRWSYLDNGWPSMEVLGNGTVTYFTFNGRAFLTDLQSKTSGGSLLADFGGIVCDSLGNVVSDSVNVPGSASASGSDNYTHNGQDQLTQGASGRDGGYTETFGYDGAFNPTTFKGSVQTFNADNQNSAFTFDGNGNPETYGGSALTWDAENRLTASGTLLTAGYNGDNLRAWKQNSQGSRTYFIYDGTEPVCEINATGAVVAVNTFGANGLLSRRAGTSSVFYTMDPQGSVCQRLDPNQNVLTTSIFDAFGSHLSAENTGEPWGYAARSGYYTDPETGLQLLTRRYYDPGRGRFLNRDPTFYAGGMNLYAYVANRPLFGTDPYGTDSPGPIASSGDPSGALPLPPSPDCHLPCPDLLGLTGGIEGYGILGGGVSLVACCDGGKPKLYVVGKVCLGAALYVSAGGGPTIHEGCPDYHWGAEFSVGYGKYLGVEGDVGVGDDSVEGGGGGGVGVPIVPGPPVKVVFCHYWWHQLW